MPSPDDPRPLVYVKHCARCGGDHGDMVFSQFTRPVTWAGEVIATHWSICPATADPIMLSIGGNQR